MVASVRDMKCTLALHTSLQKSCHQNLVTFTFSSAILSLLNFCFVLIVQKIVHARTRLCAPHGRALHIYVFFWHFPKKNKIKP